MLDKFLLDPVTVGRRSADIFGCHLDSLVTIVSELGYSRASVRLQLWIMSDLERWLQRKSLAVVDLDEKAVDLFLERRRRKACSTRSDARTVRHFLEHLRDKGAVQPLEPTGSSVRGFAIVRASLKPQYSQAVVAGP